MAQTPAAPATAPSAGPAAGSAAGTPPSSEVVVTGQRSALRTSIDRLSYDVANDLQTQTGSAADALRNVPGVEVDPQGNVSLRGDGNVTVLIDGRPSGQFQGEGRGDALQQFPADQLLRVEVITNPNAALSPEGTAGVINLVTKRDRKAGATGSVRASVGTSGRWNAGLSGSRTGKKLTLSGDVGFRGIGGETSEERDRARLDTGSGLFLPERTRTNSETTGGGFRTARLSANYAQDSRTTLSAELAHRGFGVESDATERFAAENASGAVSRAYDRLVDSSFDRGGTELRTSWRRNLGKQDPSGASADHELVFDFSLERTDFQRDIDARFTNQIPSIADSVQRFSYSVISDEARLKGEYATPMGAASARFGFEVEAETTDYDNFGATGATFSALTTNTALTNRFQYDQTVQALFATYERPLGKLTVQGGLRLEQVNIDIDQKTTGITASNDYFRAFPTLFATYDITDNQRLRASYSQRIQRPGAQDLNPFLVFIDPQNFRQGNPQLDPEITDSYELGYQFRRGQTFYLGTLLYRESSDGVTDVVRDQGGGVFLTTRENLSQSRRAGLELVANGRLTKTITYNVSGSALWNEIDVRSTGFTGTRDGTSVSTRASVNWQPTAKDFFQLSGSLNGEQLQAQGVREASGTLNLGYRRKINERVSLVLTGNNVLDTFKEAVTVDTPTLRDRSERIFITPGVLIGFTWALGDVAGQPNTRRRQDPGFDFDTGGGPPG